MPFEQRLTAGGVIDWRGTDTWVATEIRHRLTTGGVSTSTLALADMPVLAAPPYSA